MGLTSWLAGLSAERPPVFVVTAPGAAAVRLAVEAEVRRRGWRSVSSPVACSLLVVCGEPGPVLERAVERVLREIPRPRVEVRISVPDQAHISLLLDRAVSELADLGLQRADTLSPAHGLSGEGEAGPEMADRGPDRDGLELDRLHARLGPVLADWPAGLVVRVVLQGDVVQEAETETVEGVGGGSFWTEPWTAAREGAEVTRGGAERRRAACSLDALGRLLAVAGWERAAGQARWLRDDLLADQPSGRLTARFERLSRCVLRSRTLRWMLRDLGPVEAPGPFDRLEGDAVDRLRSLLGETRTALDLLDDPASLDPPEDDRDVPGMAPVSLLPDLLVGADLGAARLIVASLDPDLDRPAAMAVHG